MTTTTTTTTAYLASLLDLLDALGIAGPTWAPWRTFVKAVYGGELDHAEMETFRKHTGRLAPRPGGYPEACVIVGVQSGKSRIAAALAVHAALLGESGTHALLLGQDHRGALRVLLEYAREPFETLDEFKAEVQRANIETLTLKNGVSLSAYPCRPAAVRGVRACFVAIDELAFFTATDGRPTDTEMLRVARGRVATTGGKVIVLSSPYAQTGALWDLHRKHYGVEGSSSLVWQASAPEMNPTLGDDYLAKAAEDPEAYRSEVLGEFRAGISSLIDPDALAAVVVEGLRELAPVAGKHRYVAFVDSASGSGKDAFAVAIAHGSGGPEQSPSEAHRAVRIPGLVDGGDSRTDWFQKKQAALAVSVEQGSAVLDLVHAWKPPFNPSGVIAEVADVLRTYGLREVTGDRFAAGFVLEGFRINRLAYRYSEQDRSLLYLNLLPAVNAGKVQLLDVAELLKELRGLERRRGPSGRDRVDHRPGAHDDLANAAAGALGLALAQSRGPGVRRRSFLVG